MKIFASAIAAIVLSITFCNVSQATIISNVVAAPDSPGITFGATSFTHLTNGNGNTLGPSVNTITLNATFEASYVKNTPFNWTINFVESDTDPAVNGNTKYFVTVNLLNNGIAAPIINYQEFALGPITETLNLVPALQVGSNSFVSASSPAPTSSIGTASASGATVGFSNLAPLNPGDTATLTFTLDLADYSNGLDTSTVTGNFALSMIANPEPASLALAGFALSASGAGAFIRRKKKAVVMVEEQASAVV